MSSQSKLAEVRVNKLAANIVGTLLAIVLCVAGVLLTHLLPHHISFADWHGLALLISVVALLPIHEALHVVGLLIFARVSWSDIRFGVRWRALMPYCHCMVPIPLRAYRRMALLPLWITGAASVISLLIFAADWLGAFAGSAVAACVGDVWIVAKLRGFTDDLLVQDSPSEIGCDVFSTITETAAYR
jgi:hypothetical protein